MSSSNHFTNLGTITRYYKINNNIEKIIPIINGESEISCRLIDSFIASKTARRSRRVVTWRISHHEMLKRLTKRGFDVFCRSPRIKFQYNETSFITTTLGQLRYFIWLLENDILDYIKYNIIEIKNLMGVGGR